MWGKIRISNIEQGISNDEVRNAGSLSTTYRDSDSDKRVKSLVFQIFSIKFDLTGVLTFAAQNNRKALMCQF